MPAGGQRRRRRHRHGEPVVGVVADQLDQQRRGQMRSVGREAADVDRGVLDLPPARRGRARIVQPLRNDLALGQVGLRERRVGVGREPVDVAAVVAGDTRASRRRPSPRSRTSASRAARSPGGARSRRAPGGPSSISPARQRVSPSTSPARVSPYGSGRVENAYAARCSADRAAPTARPTRTRRPIVHQSSAAPSRSASAGTTVGSIPATGSSGVCATSSSTSTGDAGILARVLTDLPLPAEHPERVGDLGREAALDVAVGRHRLDPAVVLPGHAAHQVAAGAAGRRAPSTSAPQATRRPGGRAGPSARGPACGSRARSPGSASAVSGDLLVGRHGEQDRLRAPGRAARRSRTRRASCACELGTVSAQSSSSATAVAPSASSPGP